MSGTRILHPSILREYDIRGVVGRTLSADDALAIGRAFGTIVRQAGGEAIALGYDGRLSSPDLALAVRSGLLSTGLDVVEIGLATSPQLYFAVHHLEVDGGIQVTGSHNPPQDNGFKMMLARAPFYGNDVRRLAGIVRRGSYANGNGRFERACILEQYVERQLRDHGGEGIDGLKIAWDPGNGAAGPVVERIIEELPGKHRVLNGDVDGRFPNHHPDPTVPANLVQLRDFVTANGYDLGFAFDGDGDRIGVIDGRGRIVWPDQLMVLLARDVLARNRGATVIADVKASQVLFDEINRAGGRPLMWRTGHSLIKSKMAEVKAPLAGEMSGHIFFADQWYGFDDALYAALRTLAASVKADITLSNLVDSLPPVVNTPEIRFGCAGERKFAVVQEIGDRLAKSGHSVISIDGVRALNEDGWWLIRASNTQDVLVARCEARDQLGLIRVKRSLVDQLARSGVALPVELQPEAA